MEAISGMRRWLLPVGASVLLGGSPAAAVVTLHVGSAAGRPGDSVTVDVTLTMSDGEEVAGAQADIAFDPAVAPVAARANGRPDCDDNPAIRKGATLFAFRPHKCSPARGEC